MSSLLTAEDRLLNIEDNLLRIERMLETVYAFSQARWGRPPGACLGASPIADLADATKAATLATETEHLIRATHAMARDLWVRHSGKVGAELP
jgi:hypothetical protein